MQSAPSAAWTCASPARELHFPRQDVDVELIVASANGPYVEFRDDLEATNRMTPTAYLRLRWTWL